MSKIINLKKDNFQSGLISVKLSKLIGKSQLNNLLNLNFDEIIKFLEEHDFKQAVDASYLQYDGFYLIEKILNNHISRIYSEIFFSSSKQNKILLETYYLKYQIHNLMALIRCKISKEEEFEAFLIGESRKKEKFIKAFQMKKIEDAIEYICKKISIDPIIALKNYSLGLYHLENYLYKQYYLKLSKFKFSFNGLDEKKFIKHTKVYIDLLNTRTYLRNKINKSKDIKFDDLYIPGGYLSYINFSNQDKNDLNSSLKYFNTIFGDIEICSKEYCLVSIDKRINIHKSNSNSIFSKTQFSSPFNSLKYLFLVEQEMAKLRIILKAKYLHLSEEEIKQII